MKDYTSPAITVITLDSNDILTASNLFVDGQGDIGATIKITDL